MAVQCQRGVGGHLYLVFSLSSCGVSQGGVQVVCGISDSGWRKRPRLKARSCVSRDWAKPGQMTLYTCPEQVRVVDRDVSDKKDAYKTWTSKWDVLLEVLWHQY